MTDLPIKIKAWLNKHGYPLEMEIARAMQSVEFSVVQSEYIEDSDTGILRETDIVAYQESHSKTCRVISAVTVECKSGKDKPWVIFTSADKYPPELSVSRRATSKHGKSILRSLALRSEIQTLLPFALPQRQAHGITIALRETNNDYAYSALNSVAKASLGIVSRLSKVEYENIIPIAFPIIVIEAPLFEAFLGVEGELQVEPIEMGFLIWKNPVIDYHTLIHIYRKERFISDLPHYRDHLLELCAYAAAENDRSPRNTG